MSPALRPSSTTQSAPSQAPARIWRCTAVPSVGAVTATSVCPTGTTDDGLVATFRACRLPTVISGTLTLPKIAGVFYRLRGQTEIGTDVGTTGADNGAILNIELQPRHWGEVAGAVASTRRLAGLARTAPQRGPSSSRETTFAV